VTSAHAVATLDLSNELMPIFDQGSEPGVQHSVGRCFPSLPKVPTLLANVLLAKALLATACYENCVPPQTRVAERSWLGEAPQMAQVVPDSSAGTQELVPVAASGALAVLQDCLHCYCLSELQPAVRFVALW